jgi:hypothetical protein
VASTLGYTREAQDAVDRVGTRILPTRQQLPVLRRCRLIARDDDCRTCGGEQPNTRRVADTALKVRLALQESTAAPERSEMTTTPFNEPEACQPLILPLMVSAPFAASPLSVAVTVPVPTKLPRLSILIVALRSPPNVQLLPTRHRASHSNTIGQRACRRATAETRPDRFAGRSSSVVGCSSPSESRVSLMVGGAAAGVAGGVNGSMVLHRLAERKHDVLSTFPWRSGRWAERCVAPPS